MKCKPWIRHFSSGTKVCTGDFAPPEPEFRAEFRETNFGRPNFGPEFLGWIFWACFFQQKRPPEKFTLEKFTSKNSPSKIQPRNRAKKFTLHLCRAAWLTFHLQNSSVSVHSLHFMVCAPLSSIARYEKYRYWASKEVDGARVSLWRLSFVPSGPWWYRVLSSLSQTTTIFSSLLF